MCEIEHFLKEDEKDHPKFKTVANLRIPLFPMKNQVSSGKVRSKSVRACTIPAAVVDTAHSLVVMHQGLLCTLGEAVRQGIIANETLGYFIGRTYLFLIESGIKTDKIRFRQHMQYLLLPQPCSYLLLTPFIYRKE